MTNNFIAGNDISEKDISITKSRTVVRALMERVPPVLSLESLRERQLAKDKGDEFDTNHELAPEEEWAHLLVFTSEISEQKLEQALTPAVYRHVVALADYANHLVNAQPVLDYEA
jgi:hypothetical protein